jgi:two-component system, NarL family, response regulator LiaR
LHLLHKYRQPILYGLCLAILLFLLKWMEYRFLLVSHAYEIYITLIALLFTGLGIWLARKLTKPRVILYTEMVTIEKEVIQYKEAPQTFVRNEAECQRLGISQRELEVLELMAAGRSNGEIAAQLFVSLNTIKTHSSRIFEKLDVQRRTQAVEKAKRLGLIR